MQLQNHLKDLPIYEALLERDLLRDGTHIKLKEPMVMDLLIEQAERLL